MRLIATRAKPFKLKEIREGASNSTVPGAARFAGIAGALGALALLADPALAQDAATQAADVAAMKGDTAFMFICTVLVLLMTVPGLALFYGGMVRTKNMLSMCMQVFSTVCLAAIIWMVYGYSMAFTSGPQAFGAFVGGFDKSFLSGVTASSTADTFTKGVVIPEYVFMAFQMTFACITPALIVGAIAERVKFSAVLVFVALWVTLVYFPIAHMVWHSDGYLFKLGALDFAGGTVVHIDAGIAGLIGALIAGRRIGYMREAMPPHSLTMTMIGAALLWVGWFGFNCGSNLEATGTAILAMANTFAATAAAGLAWILAEWVAKGKPSLLGLASGVVAGLVAVTPASGFAGPMGSMVLGLIAGTVCFMFCTSIKHAIGYDDSLDVFGVHCVGGIIGSLLTGVLASAEYGGAGLAEGMTVGAQVVVQASAVVVTLIWSGGVSAVLYYLIDMVIGLRPSEDGEREGLDITDHGERAYNY
ncbi:MAG TPA: ammonium transporter [Hyphomicrobium sp.]|nr:ammonium transporter [Hyphomicrobium sp.]